jgi:DNA polymerase-1
MAERKKLAIIDGKSVFYRGYYALPNLSTAQGVPTGGVYGFAAMALELIKRLKPDYVAVAWDKPKTNIRKRKEMYPEYKAGRKPAPPDFYAQIPLLHELLDAFGWPLYELDDYEADDIMGALAVQARKKDIETMLITSDLDMLQLVNGHVHVYALKKGLTNIELFKADSFKEKYGITPDQFLDLKSLKGDSSDNVPGVPGIGEKTALELLKSYKNLDAVYQHLPDIKDSVRAKLEAGKESAYLSKKLLEIWCDAPIKLDLKAVDGSKIDTARVAQLLQKLEFRSLLRNLPGHMQNQVPSTDKVAGAVLKLPENVLIASDKDLKNLKLEKSDTIFVHSRAAGAHGSNPQVLIIGSQSQIYTLDLTKLSSGAVKKVFSPVPGKLIGYDVKSDIKLITNLGVTGLEVKHDVLVGAFLLNSLLRVQSMTELATINLEYEGESFEDLPTEDFIARAPEIMAVIRELYHGQIQALEEVPEIQKLATNTEWPLIPVLANMELAGIKLDVDYLRNFAKQIDGTISDLEQQIYGHADHEFNISSPAQLADVLFAKLNLPTQGVKKGKTGYSTAASELEKLRGLHPVIDLISQYREVTKLKNTYVDTLPLLVDKNSRVHTTFNLTIAQTGRLSSTEPNLQNIPIRTELGKNIRTAFVAEKGNVLVSADYSQFELRLAAALSNDKDMINAFNRDADIHAETAAAIYNIKPQEVTKTQRSSVKAVNFGIMYGLGPHALSQSTSMSFGEARDFIKRYFEIRPKLKEYIDSLRQQADKQGYVETLLGRRRPTPDVHSSNFAVREAAYRAAVNMPMQGTAADIMKMAMVAVAKKLPSGAKMLLQIHDSLIVECPEKQAETVGKILKGTMENVYKLSVKLTVDISTGKNWGAL